MSHKLTIRRVSLSTTCEMGVVVDAVNGLPFACCIESPWLQNQQQISCIPTGTYKCSPFTSEENPDVYEVKNVPNRQEILFKIGEFVGDCKGDICLGMYFSDTIQTPQVFSSEYAMTRLRDLIGQEDFSLVIF